jgi:hypothetical protein
VPCSVSLKPGKRRPPLPRVGVGVRSRPKIRFLFFGLFLVRSLKFQNRIYLTNFDNRKVRVPDISVFSSVMTVLCKRGRCQVH